MVGVVEGDEGGVGHGGSEDSFTVVERDELVLVPPHHKGGEVVVQLVDGGEDVAVVPEEVQMPQRRTQRRGEVRVVLLLERERLLERSSSV